MIEQLRTADVHPPLYHTTVWLAIRALGDGETAVRLPSIVFGTLVIPAIYLAGREIYDRRTGLVSAALSAIAPVAVWYSQEARMYSLVMLLSILAVWVQFRALRTGRLREWLLLGILDAALAWTMYLAIFLVIAQYVVLFAAVLRRRRDSHALKRLLLGCLVAAVVTAILLAPLFPYAWTQAHGPNYSQFSKNTSSTGSHDPGIGLYAVITNGVWAVLGYHSNRAITSIVAMWPAGVLAGLLLLGRGRSARTMALVTLVSVPGVLLYLQGLRAPDTFTLRYLSAAVPVLYLLLARLLTRVVSTDVATCVVTGVLTVCLCAALVDQQLNGENPRRYDFREALHSVTRSVGRDDVIVYAPTYLRDVIQYYAPTLTAVDASANLKIRTRGRVIVLGSFFEVPGMYEQIGTVLAHLRQSGRIVTDQAQYANVRIWVLQ
jgi:uncharacterized membrane protein